MTPLFDERKIKYVHVVGTSPLVVKKNKELSKCATCVTTLESCINIPDGFERILLRNGKDATINSICFLQNIAET